MTPLRLLAVLGGMASLAGCAFPLQSSSTPPPSADAVAACNTRADEQFLRQNRDLLYKSDDYQTSVRDSPYAGQGLAGSTAGLSDQYARNQDVRSCLNGVAPSPGSQPAATSAP